MTLQELGTICRDYRRSIGLTQNDVSRETSYSISVVSWFENGKNNNAMLLLWYIQRGLKL